MALPPSFTPVNHDDDDINRIQDHISNAVNPLTNSPLAGVSLVKGIVVKEGLNEVPHGLARVPQGYVVVAQHGALMPVGWTNMTLTAPFIPLGTWPSPAYRVVQGGKVELRGLFKAASAPAANQAIWTYPSTAYGPTGGGVNFGRLYAVTQSFNGGAWRGLLRCDAYTTNFNWNSEVYATNGVVAAITSVDFGSLDNISWDAIGPAPVQLASAQDKNPLPSSTYRLISSGAGTVDLLFF